MRVLAIVLSVGFLSAANGLFSSSASASSSMETALELGSVLASEEVCGLSFDPIAIERYIEARVAADDMGFAPMLQTMIAGHEYQLQDMSAAAKAAHCAQIRRVARANGFISE